MCGSNPISIITDPLRDGIAAIGDAGKKGISEIGNAGTDTGRWFGDSTDKLGREAGRGLGDLTGKNAYEAGMQRAADRQEAESNRLLWERDNKLAQSKESDMQEEARKRMKAGQESGRSGTILTGFDQGTSTQLGASGGKTILGA